MGCKFHMAESTGVQVKHGGLGCSGVFFTHPGILLCNFTNTRLFFTEFSVFRNPASVRCLFSNPTGG